MRQSSPMMKFGRTVTLRGELQASEDLMIEGQVDGPVWCDGCAVTIAETATLTGDVIARDITVFGRVDGTLVATEVVDIRSEALVTGRVVASRFILTEGASFHGSAEPQHLEAALRVARHRYRKPDAPPPAPAASPAKTAAPISG
jgi:cytoskeletal protein CcmA (bactofilin family)